MQFLYNLVLALIVAYKLVYAVKFDVDILAGGVWLRGRDGGVVLRFSGLLMQAF